MKKVFYVIFAVVIATTLVSNLDWRLGDYGYHSISLDSKVMAQTTSTTGGGGGDTPTPPTPPQGYTPEDKDCEMDITGDVEAELKFLGLPNVIKVESEGGFKLIFQNVARDCKFNGEYLCETLTCADFWFRMKTN